MVDCSIINFITLWSVGPRNNMMIRGEEKKFFLPRGSGCLPGCQIARGCPRKPDGCGRTEQFFSLVLPALLLFCLTICILDTPPMLASLSLQVPCITGNNMKFLYQITGDGKTVGWCISQCLELPLG
jgi:hypothetical protein